MKLAVAFFAVLGSYFLAPGMGILLAILVSC